MQAELERAIQAVTGERVVVQGASRTDSGVHALGQSAHFRTKARLFPDRWLAALNRHLPPDVSILQAKEVPSSFHARDSAQGKVYEYHIVNRPARSALERRFAWHISKALDVPAMRKAARAFVGEKDFRVFSSTGSSQKTFRCNITRFQIQKQTDRISFRIRGERFLYHMVRHMVGHLVQIGLGKKTLIREPAPPQGLFLMEVLY